MKPWMLLSNGKKFFPDCPTIDDIDIDTIAHALSQICRFGGHTKFSYSVAQHSWMVSWLLGQMGEAQSTQLRGLLHDAAEAYIGDVTRPIKHLWKAYPKIESRMTSLVYRRFGLRPQPYGGAVEFADNTLLVTERRDLMPPCEEKWPIEKIYTPLKRKIIPVSSRKAKEMFLHRFHQLL